MSTRKGAQHATLYEQYAQLGLSRPVEPIVSQRTRSFRSASPESVRIPEGETKSSVLRKDRVRINCYLNAEGVGVTVIGGPRGHGTIVRLPLECDTLAEVIPLIQLKLDLEKRLLFAHELWLPDGTSVKSFEQLCDAAAIATPIIVGCGEPFDAARVPKDLLEFHKHGGGRRAVSKVNSGLNETRKSKALASAESVRQAGHGLLPNCPAVVAARTQNVETNRERAATMRQYYLESLVRRTADQEDLKMSAKQNMVWNRMEREESRMRAEEKQQERMEWLRRQRERDMMDLNAAKREDQEYARRLHDKVKSGETKGKERVKKQREFYRKEAKKGSPSGKGSPGSSPEGMAVEVS